MPEETFETEPLPTEPVASELTAAIPPPATEPIVPQPDAPENLRAAEKHEFWMNAPDPLVTIALIVVNAVLFVASSGMEIGAITHTRREQLLAWGANYGLLTFYGQWWRILTSCLLHFSFLHIAMNMLVLFQVGNFAEKLYGHTRLLLIFVVAGVGGSLLGVAVHPQAVSAGASGAIFGLYGAVLAYLLFQWGEVAWSDTWRIGLSAVFFITCSIIYALRVPEIDLAGHFGGLIAGFVAGAILATPLSQREWFLPPIRSAAVCVLTVAVTGAVFVYVPKKQPAADFYSRLLAGKSVVAGLNNRVFYQGKATEDDAHKLAEKLFQSGMFRFANFSLLLTRDANNVPTLSFLAKDKHPAPAASAANGGGAAAAYVWNDPRFVASLKNLGATVAPSLGGPPVNVVILSVDGVTEKSITIDTRIAHVGLHDAVWYSGDATLHEAETLGKALQDIGYFHDRGARVFLARSGENSDITYELNAFVFDMPNAVAGFRAIDRKLSRALGSGKFRFHMADPTLEHQKDL